jgi:hypothetical protein
MSTVYCWAPDALYDLKLNGSVTKWAQRNRLNMVRYPGGVASAWDWEYPTGYMGHSGLNPDQPQAPAALWMSLGEYLQLCHELGSKPLVGVNYNCHNGEGCNRSLADSLSSAVKQVKYVVEQGFPGAFFYIGNEECQTDCSGSHADLIVQHALAMKAVDPTIQTLWNCNELKAPALQAFLEQKGADGVTQYGTVMDGVDIHGKWPHGGPDNSGIPFEQYLAEVPLVDHKCGLGLTWRQRIASLRRVSDAFGRPDFLLMNNEFGLGKPGAFKGNWSRFQLSLVAMEFAMELHIGGFDVAAFWDNGDGEVQPDGKFQCANCNEGGNAGQHFLTSTVDGHRFNPMLNRWPPGLRASGAGAEPAHAGGRHHGLSAARVRRTQQHDQPRAGVADQQVRWPRAVRPSDASGGGRGAEQRGLGDRRRRPGRSQRPALARAHAAAAGGVRRECVRDRAAAALLLHAHVACGCYASGRLLTLHLLCTSTRTATKLPGVVP